MNEVRIELLHMVIPFEQFNAEIENLITEGEKLYKQNVQDATQLDELKAKDTDWIKRSLDLLESSFSQKQNPYKQIYQAQEAQSFTIPNARNVSLHGVTQNEKNKIQGKKRALSYLKNVLSVSDLVITPEKVELKQRQKFTIEEKLYFLLEKLFKIYSSDFHYSIPLIFFGNGIDIVRQHEDREFAKILEQRGLVTINSLGRTLDVQLTTEGAIFVEKISATVKENYERINTSEAELERSINEIKKRVTTIEYGQEILFNELQEIKDLFPTLNKKSWAQLIKGKLVDLAVGKIVTVEAAKFIYEQLTGTPLHIPLLGIGNS